MSETEDEPVMETRIFGVDYKIVPSPEGGCNGCVARNNHDLCSHLPGDCITMGTVDMIWVSSTSNGGDPTDAHPV